MEEPPPQPGDSLLMGSSMSDVVVGDLDFMDEFLLASPGFDCSDLLQPGTSTVTSPFGSSEFSPVFEITSDSAAPIPEDAERSNLPTRTHFDATPMAGAQRNSLFQPSDPMVTVKERLRRALSYIASQRDGELLVQVWVPTRIGDRQVLTTCGQPFWLDQRSERLVSYRSVSMKYQFSADESSRTGLGLPGRVFVGKVPEWTPDVRYFTSEEYPRVGHARCFDIRGSIGFPIFERSSRSCLGVVELVMTTQKINYNAEIEHICNALQEVDLRSSDVSSDPRAKVPDVSYRDIVPEILGVLRAVCDTHKLPLAQTWIPCICQAKRGSRHSDEKYKYCVSTVDDACYVRDPSMMGFHQASSEHHLFQGEGVVGRAFGTNEPCFSPDITAYSKFDYPLSHYAKLFSLRAAVAIRLRSARTGSLDFVLEFFLPINCIKSEEQRIMLNSLSITLQQVCHTLRIVSAKELANNTSFQTSKTTLPDMFSTKAVHDNFDELCSGNNASVRATSLGASEEVSSWIASLVEAPNRGAKLEILSCVPFEFSMPENERFSVTAGWGPSPVVVPGESIFSGFKQHEKCELKEEISQRGSYAGEPNFSNSDKAAEKRRTKTEKTVSLQDLRKHFAGSLKDAAKNLGVCPTTLKRICRQHGITRWPSRKIKKVGHSLKKLQTVIDSVHGPEGAVQLSSLYENFTKTTWSEKDLQGDISFSALKQNVRLESSNPNQLHEGRFSSHTSASNSLSSSCSQSSTSSLGCSSGLNQQHQHGSAPQLAIKQEISMEENQSCTLTKALSHAELQVFTEERPVSLSRSQSHKLLSEHPPTENLPNLQKDNPASLKIKAIYREEKCIFRFQPTLGFQDLKDEITKRFNIAHKSYMDIKYLDDESEWVLLTCDADLQECIDVYKLLNAHTIRISVNTTCQPVIGASFGRTCLS